MERKMKLGDYLVAYLKKIGVSHLFGIPGDLVINLFLKFGRPKRLKIITLSHEPGAFPINYRLHMGVYAGAVSPAGIRARVENADLIISLGMFLTDIEMGGSLPPEELR